jgi:hypothetical protein
MVCHIQADQAAFNDTQTGNEVVNKEETNLQKGMPLKIYNIILSRRCSNQ